jgi:hypothetical protein
MFVHLRNAQLILYPDLEQGAVLQYRELFAGHVTMSSNACPERHRTVSDSVATWGVHAFKDL